MYICIFIFSFKKIHVAGNGDDLDLKEQVHQEKYLFYQAISVDNFFSNHIYQLICVKFIEDPNSQGEDPTQ